MKYKLIISLLLGLFLISLVSATITTTLNSPSDGLTNSFSSINFNCSASTNLGFINNISLFTNSTGSWVNNQTVSVVNYTYNLTNMSDTGLGARIFTLAKSIPMNNTIVTSFTNYFYAVTVDGTAGIKIGFVYSNGTSVNTTNVNTSSLTPVQVLWNPPANYSAVPMVKIDIYIAHWSATSGVATVEGGDNATVYNYSTTQTFPFNLTGITKWNCLACDNNSVCSYSASNRTVNFDTILNSINYNSTTYETSTESYILNITPTGYVPTNAKLIYNGTSYSIAPTTSGGGYVFSKSLEINSSLIGSNNFYYIWNVSSTVSETSPTYSQTISPIQFGLCNGTLTVPYLNISFKDESSLNYMKAQIPNSVFVYYLGDGSVNKTLTFVNTTDMFSFSFCALPSDRAYQIDPYVQYKNETSYPQRIWDAGLTTYTNSTTNQTLYLLDSSNGIYVTYQVLDGIGNQLSGVQVVVNRTISGSNYQIGTGLTDVSGAITFWLDPDFAHSISFSKTGYELFTLAQFPTQSSYTVTLGTSSGSQINDYIRGITYTVLPNYGITLNASQLYNFNMTLNSTYWTLDSFGFILYGDGAIIGGNSSSSSSGFISNVLNISSYEHISIETYWVINGTTTYGINNGWFTFDYTEGTGWSIANFFTDLKNYTSPTYHPETNSYTGIFGLDTNSLNFIVFAIIFLITGLVSYKFSLTSSTVITGVIFGLVFLFDVALGLITMPFLTVTHFPTIFMLLIVVASAIWEMRR